MKCVNLYQRIYHKFISIFNSMIQEMNLTASQVEMLIFITRKERNGERVIQRDIENALSLSNPTVSGTLDRLEKKDMIVRKSDPGNRRINLIGLTEKAIAKRDFVQNKLEEVQSRALNDFSDEEIAQLENYLERIWNNIN